MAAHNELGKKGEQMALEWLIQKGYVILETNWRFEKAEVDIIARDADELVIVEVKTRSTAFFGEPEEAVDATKERLLVGAAEAYVEMKNLDMDVRFDIIAIVIQSGKASIRHIRDAFYPGL
jgi:putative endonuclease